MGGSGKAGQRLKEPRDLAWKDGKSPDSAKETVRSHRGVTRCFCRGVSVQ